MPDSSYQEKVEAVRRRCLRTMALVFGFFTVVGTVVGILIELHEPAEATTVFLGFVIGAAVGGGVAMLTVPGRYNREIERITQDHRRK